MTRRKRLNLVLRLAQAYVRENISELKDVPLHVRALDGPPGAPRYSVTAEVCVAGSCPRGTPTAIAAAGNCTIHSCPLRRSARLLLDASGAVLQVTRGGIHWG